MPNRFFSTALAAWTTLNPSSAKISVSNFLAVCHTILIVIFCRMLYGIESTYNSLVGFFSFFLITFLFYVVLILWAEILSWSLMGVNAFMPLDGKKKMAITPKTWILTIGLKKWLIVKNCSFKKDGRKLTVSRKLAKILTVNKFWPQSHHKKLFEILLIVLEATCGWLHSIFIMDLKLDIFILAEKTNIPRD